MRDQHGRAVLQRQGAAGRGDGIGQRRQRILHGGDFQPRGLKQRDDLGPARSVRPRPVHQHDIACFHRCGRLRVRFNSAERCCQRGDGECENDAWHFHRANSVTKLFQ